MPPVEIMEDLFFIQRGYLNGNHFVYRSEDPVLVDTGYVSDFQTTVALIQSLGVDLSRTRLIVNTHCHCDHIGGNKMIQERSTCDIAMHKIGKQFIDTWDDWSTWWKYYQQDADFFNCTTALENGDRLSVGPHEFEVIYTPGHSSDGIVLYHKKEKVLISSDTLWEDDMAVMTIRVEGSRACFSYAGISRKARKPGCQKGVSRPRQTFQQHAAGHFKSKAKTERLYCQSKAHRERSDQENHHLHAHDAKTS